MDCDIHQPVLEPSTLLIHQLCLCKEKCQNWYLKDGKCRIYWYTTCLWEWILSLLSFVRKPQIEVQINMCLIFSVYRLCHPEFKKKFKTHMLSAFSGIAYCQRHWWPLSGSCGLLWFPFWISCFFSQSTTFKDYLYWHSTVSFKEPSKSKYCMPELFVCSFKVFVV